MPLTHPHYTQSCEKCREFEDKCRTCIEDLQRTTNEARTTPTTLYHSVAQLKLSAESGCDFCRVWLRALVNECFSLSELAALFKSLTAVVLEPPLEYASFHTFDIKVRSSKVTCVKLSSRMRVEDQPARLISQDDLEDIALQKRVPSMPDMWLVAVHEDPLSSHALWSRAYNWLHHCTSAHDACRKPRYTPIHIPECPRRLIDVTHETHARVFDTDCKTIFKYAALSYCWGTTGQKVKLTASYKEEIYRGIKFSKLALSIQHAIKVCKFLGLSYLWVDAICIEQDDSGEDFRSEAARMHHIYGSAVVTIVASSSAQATEGFLRPRMLETPSIRARNVHFCGHMLYHQRKPLDEVRALSPLSSRAWCFQEEFLSPRLLYISDHGLYWSCSQYDVAENGNHYNRLDEGFASPAKASVILRPHEFSHAGHPLYKWDRMVEQYSSRQCSRPEDRLTAMMGLAALVGARVGEATMFGMWRSRLPSQLLWWVVMRPSITPVIHAMHQLSISEHAQIPSWSWASTPPEYAVRMPTAEMSHSRARLLDDSTGRRDGGRVLELKSRARFLLRGRSDEEHESMAWAPMAPSRADTQAFSAVDETRLQICVWEEGRDPVNILLDYPLEDHIMLQELVCFEINYKGFLLLEHRPDDMYRRIGCCPSHDDPSFFDLSENGIIRLT